MSTSSSKPRSSVTLLVTQGLITSIFTFVMSTYKPYIKHIWIPNKTRQTERKWLLTSANFIYHVHRNDNPRHPQTVKVLTLKTTDKIESGKQTRCSNSGANFCDFISFACLLENRVSWSADVPWIQNLTNLSITLQLRQQIMEEQRRSERCWDKLGRIQRNKELIASSKVPLYSLERNRPTSSDANLFRTEKIVCYGDCEREPTEKGGFGAEVRFKFSDAPDTLYK